MASYYSEPPVVPRNGHTLVVGIVARISGCASQKELSLDDQVDHAKEVIDEMYDGPVEYRIIATKGKGERLDRPELDEIEQAYRSRELDVCVMEDVGRMVRGTEAVRLWGIGVDHGTRSIAPNDCCDTIDETWEEDLISACRDHVGHNTHTSRRLKKKLMNRFKKFGGAMARPVAGYIKPEDAKTYADWLRDDAATEMIRKGLQMLETTLNCSAVAHFFNREGFSTGPYCRRKEWDGHMVRRYYENRLLSGHPGRGFRSTIKHHETGRRVSVKNTTGEPIFLDFPHLAHVDSAELDEVNRLLAEKNARLGRKKVNGVDPFWQKPRTQTRFPGQHACCWYCGYHYVWGANGVTDNLMCSNSRDWHCWNSIGFSGEIATTRIVDLVVRELHDLDGFADQFADLVRTADANRSSGVPDRWRRLQLNEEALAREKDNLMSAILQYGVRPMFDERLKALDSKEKELRQERHYLEMLNSRKLQLPNSIGTLRELLEREFRTLAVDSAELGALLQQVVPEFYVYNVRLCDGGHLLPRARIRLDLAGSIPDAQYVPGLQKMLSRVVTLDLFDQPPQRERIREEVVRLRAEGVPKRQIARQLEEKPKPPVVDQAIDLDRRMRQLGLETPYVLVLEPPDDYPKLRRHKNPKYCFKPLEGYQRPEL